LVDTALKAAAGVTARLSHLNVTVLRPAQEADVIALSAASVHDSNGSARVWHVAIA
jgi:hypothetical protein